MKTSERKNRSGEANRGGKASGKRQPTAEASMRESGIGLLGRIPWGTHVCQFYESRQDLIDILIPYIKAGLENNEFCLWIASTPLDVDEAESALSEAVPDLEERKRQGQIEFLRYDQWYVRSERFDPDSVLRGWAEMEATALSRGFEGLRLTGNTFWLEDNDWDAFLDCTRTVNGILSQYRMLTICNYPLVKCSAADIIEVTDTHEYTLVKRGLTWRLFTSGRKKMESALHESWRRYGTLFEHVPDYALILELAGDGPLVIVDGNEAAFRKHGYTRKEIIGKPVTFLYTKASAKHEPERLRKVLSGDTAIFEVDHVCKDGSTFTCEAVVKLVTIDGIRLLFSIERDITERKRVVEDLRAERDFAESLIDTAQAIVLVLDTEGRIVRFNLYMEEISGYRLDEVQGKDWFSTFLPSRDHEKIRRIFKAAVSNIRTRGNINPILTRDGIEIEIEWYDKTLKDAEGRVVGLLAIGQDVTERMRAEEALRNKQKLESLGTLAGGIAHDFNNILTGIVGNLSLLKSELKSGDEELELIQEAEGACQTAKGLARQLLTFASGGVPVVQTRDLAPIVRRAADFATRGSNVKCVFRTEDRPFFAEVDKDQISQVIQNLVINSKQAMPTGGNITVDVSAVELAANEVPPLAAGRYVRVAVRDEGLGIPEDALLKVFDPFFSSKGQGRGLGLAVCHSIVVKHGGHVGVESRPGAGTTFTIQLPAVEEAPLVRKTGAALSNVSGGGWILVMDDDESVARVLKRMLKKLGYEVVTVPDGAWALEEYRKAKESGRPFDVVIMDLTIPGGMGGKEAGKQLKELDPRARAIVSSGYSNDPVMSEYEAHGFCGVLSKPYRLEDVSMLLARVLG